MATRTKKNSKPNKSIENAQKALDQLVEMFESDDLPEKIARTVIRRQASDRPSDAWSIANQMVMWFGGTEDARGFRQWEALGRKVKKGSKALYILAPLTRKITVEEKTASGTREAERTIVTGFKGVPVFRVEDTEGDPVPPPPDYTPVELPPLMDVAERFGIPVKYAPWMGAAYGSYHFDNRITLRTHDMGTYFHELAHAAHGKIETLVGGQNPRQEVIAETVAAVLCTMYGGEGRVAGSAEYIRGYAKENPGKAVVKVLSTVQKVLTLILEGEGA